MYRWEILHALTAQRAFAIVRSDSAQQAEDATLAVLDAGLEAAEVTLTTPGAIGVLTRISRDRPDALVGAGTVLDAAGAFAAVDAGARFLVAPNFDADVIRAGHRLGVPVIPGVSTPTEMMRALEEGADALKLFPASGLTPGWLRDVRAALPQAPIIPTGGVTLGNAADWIAAGAVACGIGSALTTVDRELAVRRVRQLRENLDTAL